MKRLCVFLSFFISLHAGAQAVTENLVIITFDGLRWQELFGGADEALINNTSYTEDTAEIKKKFWATTPEERRKKLLPFIWTTIAEQGQIYGNRHLGNNVNVKNSYRISYP